MRCLCNSYKNIEYFIAKRVCSKAKIEKKHFLLYFNSAVLQCLSYSGSVANAYFKPDMNRSVETEPVAFALISLDILKIKCRALQAPVTSR